MVNLNYHNNFIETGSAIMKCIVNFIPTRVQNYIERMTTNIQLIQAPHYWGFLIEYVLAT